MANKTSNSAAHLSVQLPPQSHRRVHEDDTEKGSTELVKRWKEHVVKTIKLKPAILRKKKVMVTGAAMTCKMGIRPPNRQGAASIINNLCKEFPGRKGCPLKILVDNSKVKSGKSLTRRQAKRNLTDEEEIAFINLSGEANGENSQLDRGQLQNTTQTESYGTWLEDKLKNGVAS